MMGHIGPDDYSYKVQVQRGEAWNTVHAPNWADTTTRDREEALSLAESVFAEEEQATPVRVLAIPDEPGYAVEQIMDLRP